MGLLKQKGLTKSVKLVGDERCVRRTQRVGEQETERKLWEKCGRNR
jgi:hypothetical protein